MVSVKNLVQCERFGILVCSAISALQAEGVCGVVQMVKQSCGFCVLIIAVINGALRADYYEISMYCYKNN